MYTQIRNLGYDWLAQLEASERQEMKHMLTQTNYGNYFLS